VAEQEAHFPLSSWTLAGFRAIKERTTFTLDGLNILVGENSAGKSSVLQSILLAAQTLATPMADRPLVLNGPLVRLGLPEDCVHVETGRELTIGFGLSPSREDLDRPMMSDLALIDLDLVFAIARDQQANFEISSAKVTAKSREDAVLHLDIGTRTPQQAIEAMLANGASEELAQQWALAAGFAVSGDVPEKTIGSLATQFLPETLIVLRNAHRRELRLLTESLRPRPAGRIGATRGRRREGLITPQVTSLIHSYLAHLDVSPDVLDTIPEDGPWDVEALHRLPAEQQFQLAASNRDPWFVEQLDELEFSAEVIPEPIGGPLGDGLSLARRWFAKNVRHLGPLRAAPQPLYALPEAASGMSVGPSGEYTASVLSAYGKHRWNVPLPDGHIRACPLGVSVDKWMAELGLLARVRSTEQGKLGYELSVSVEGVDRDLDLTTVGVGVSQALPIVVLGLIAERGSLLLFEQPELHLHPDVQAALGDFFLALVKAGRQVVLETHSEYLINRLRRRQAVDETSGPADLVRLFFFERSGSEAKVTPARIGRDGSMPGWPRGFLDTAAREAKAIALRSDT